MPFDPDDPRLTAYALGELEDREKAAFEAELADSDEGRKYVDEVRETARMLTLSLADEPAPRLSPHHLHGIEAELKPLRTLPLQRWAGLALAASLLVGFGVSAAWLVRGDGSPRPVEIAMRSPPRPRAPSVTAKGGRN